MFTGLVKDVGEVSIIQRNSEGLLITVNSRSISSNVRIDDSVSINGACQTVVSHNQASFTVQAVETTLGKTNFNELKLGSRVNLELALRLSDRLGGHLVQGHVNGVGKILGWKNIGDNYLLSFSIPKDLMKYVVGEGSITLNGVSLTVANLEKGKNKGEVSIIPHTWNNTQFSFAKVGESINIEVDVLAKYVENLLLYSRENKAEKKESKISEDWLKSHGFWE